MLLGDILKQYREEHQMSLQDFADLIGTSRSYIHMLEKNVNPSTNKPISPSIETLKSLAKAMNMDLETLLKQLNDEQNIYLDENEYKKQFTNNTSNSAVVFVYGTIPAGIPIECIEDIIDTEEISADMLKGDKKYFGLKIKGNSMETEYHDGDVIICEKVDDCESGTDCVVMVNGNDGTFKRVIKDEENQTIRLQPLNTSLDANGLPLYEPITFTKEQIKNLPVKIIGKVVELRRKK